MSNTPKKFHFLPFVISLLIPLTVGFIGSFLTRDSSNTWYKTLSKPSFNPPDSVFGPVWSTLFIMMGIASYLVWTRRKMVPNYTRAALVYGVQLVLNLLWSYLFFFKRQIGLALIEICVFLIVLIINASLFYKIHKVAGWLFVPYIMWVAFATYLTYSIFILN